MREKGHFMLERREKMTRLLRKMEYMQQPWKRGFYRTLGGIEKIGCIVLEECY